MMTSFFIKEGNTYKSSYSWQKNLFAYNKQLLKQFKLICQGEIPREMNMGVTKPFAIVDHVHDQLSSSLLENFVCRNTERAY